MNTLGRTLRVHGLALPRRVVESAVRACCACKRVGAHGHPTDDDMVNDASDEDPNDEVSVSGQTNDTDSDDDGEL